ncbi:MULTISPECIES: DUF1697 domain-containing protein [unclassified Sinorhizobium]|uniref:DUF1697 domain-containing protein n=1 Tax=unclassified Sinorhizobium TaxID=2613772 RepID=UPI003525E1EA
MTTYVALLHSIVLGHGRRVVMSDLRAMAISLGFSDPRTLVATGNLVFEAGTATVHDIEEQLEAGFAKRFGKHVDIIVREGGAWLKLAKANPFPEGVGSDVIVRVMRQPLNASAMEILHRYQTSKERIRLVDGDLWIDFNGKPSESRLPSALTTKRMGVGTLRNWNTVRRLAEMVAQ